MTARRFAVVACGVVLAVLATGCSTSGSNASRTGDGSIQLFKVGDRKAAPDLSGDLVGGGHTTLGSDDGKVVVINVWASWCGPCVAETPGLVDAAKSLPGVAFVGINTRNNEGDAAAFIQAKDVPYPSFYDQDGSILLQLQRVLPVSSLPQTIILDKQHRIAAAIYGTTTAITIKAIATPLERES